MAINYPFNHFSMWANPIPEEAAKALNDLYVHERKTVCEPAIAAGNGYSLESLATKYRGIVQSYLR